MQCGAFRFPAGSPGLVRVLVATCLVTSDATAPSSQEIAVTRIRQSIRYFFLPSLFLLPFSHDKRQTTLTSLVINRAPVPTWCTPPTAVFPRAKLVAQRTTSTDCLQEPTLPADLL